MRQIRKNNDFIEEYLGPAMGISWYEANGYISYDGTLPLTRLDIVDGEIVELPIPEPTVEWVSKEAFIGALYALVPADKLITALQDPATFKTGLMGLALLTTDAAPNGMIDLLDERVPAWLTTFELSIEQVRAAMQSAIDGVGEDNGVQ